MKKIAFALLLSVFVAAPAVAADGKRNIGISYGLDNDGVVGIQGEFDLSSSVNNAPISAQLFWKSYSQTYSRAVGTYQYSYTGFGVAALYDFGAVVKEDKKIRPYAGLGLFALNNQLSGPAAPLDVSADSGGIYVTAGVRYAATTEISADLNYNNIGGLTIGASFKF